MINPNQGSAADGIKDAGFHYFASRNDKIIPRYFALMVVLSFCFNPIIKINHRLEMPIIVKLGNKGAAS